MESKREPAIAKLKVRGNIIYLPNWLLRYLAIGDGDKLEIYHTGNDGEILLRRQSIEQIIKERRSKAGSDYMNRAIRLAADKEADPEELEKLKSELDDRIAEIKKLREGRE